MLNRIHRKHRAGRHGGRVLCATHPRRSRLGGEHGQAVVEFALILPVLMLVMMGIFKFGVAYNNYLSLTDAVRSGARQLAIERGQVNPCLDATNAVTAGSSLTGVTVTYTFPAPELSACEIPIASPPTTPANLVSGDSVTVTATYPTCDATVLGINFAPGCKLTASATERIE